MSDSVPMTEEGKAKLIAEMAELESRRPAIKEAIAKARDKGDLRENADYHASREEMGMLDAKLGQIAGLLANAVIVDPSQASTDKAMLGCTVLVKRLKDGRETERTLVGAGQADPKEGKILTTSPIGKAVIGASVGDIVTAELPAGPQDFELLEISFK